MIVKNTKLIIKEGSIEQKSCDIIINWVNLDLRSGPAEFYKINRIAGNQLFEFIMSYELLLKNISYSDCLSTQPGLLDCKLVLHSVIPEQKIMYNTNYYNIAKTIKTYKEKNICKSVSLFLNEEIELNIKCIYENLFNIGLEEINIIVKKEEKEIVKKLFYKYSTKKNVNDYVDDFIKYLGENKKLDEYYDKIRKKFRKNNKIKNR